MTEHSQQYPNSQSIYGADVAFQRHSHVKPMEITPIDAYAYANQGNFYQRQDAAAILYQPQQTMLNYNMRQMFHHQQQQQPHYQPMPPSAAAAGNQAIPPPQQQQQFYQMEASAQHSSAKMQPTQQTLVPRKKVLLLARPAEVVAAAAVPAVVEEPVAVTVEPPPVKEAAAAASASASAATATVVSGAPRTSHVLLPVVVATPQSPPPAAVEIKKPVVVVPVAPPPVPVPVPVPTPKLLPTFGRNGKRVIWNREKLKLIWQLPATLAFIERARNELITLGFTSKNGGGGSGRYPKSGAGGRNIELNLTESKIETVQDAYVPPSKDGGGVVDVAGEMNMILNRVMESNLQLTLDEIRSTFDMTMEANIQLLSDKLFEKVIRQAQFTKTFAKLSKLCEKFKASDGGGISFNSCLLAKSRAMIEKPLGRHLEEANARVDSEMKNTDDPNTQKIFEESRSTICDKAKDAYMGNVRFIGELYLERMVSSNTVVDYLTRFADQLNPENERCFTMLFNIVGCQLDREDRKRMDVLVRKVEEHLKSVKMDSCHVYNLQHALQARANNWLDSNSNSKRKKPSAAAVATPVTSSVTGATVDSSALHIPLLRGEMESDSRTMQFTQPAVWSGGCNKTSTSSSATTVAKWASTTAPPVSRAAAELTEAQYEAELEMARRHDPVNLFIAKDQDFARSIDNCPCKMAFIHVLLERCLDKKENYRRSAGQLLLQVLLAKGISQMDMEKGVAKFGLTLPDLIDDCPKALDYLAEVFAQLLQPRTGRQVRQVVQRLDSGNQLKNFQVFAKCLRLSEKQWPELAECISEFPGVSLPDKTRICKEEMITFWSPGGNLPQSSTWGGQSWSAVAEADTKTKKGSNRVAPAANRGRQSQPVTIQNNTVLDQIIHNLSKENLDFENLKRLMKQAASKDRDSEHFVVTYVCKLYKCTVGRTRDVKEMFFETISCFTQSAALETYILTGLHQANESIVSNYAEILNILVTIKILSVEACKTWAQRTGTNVTLSKAINNLTK